MNLKIRIKDVHKAMKDMEYIQPTGMSNPDKMLTKDTLVQICKERFGV